MRKRLTVLGTAVLAALAVAAPATAWAADDRLTGSITLGGSYTCRGEPAVLVDDDYWSGTFGDDVVVAVAEDADTINLLDGNDLLCIHVARSDSHAAVVVNAGNGNDTVVTYGGGFHDIYLDAGNDIAYLNGFNEVVYGGSGNDHMWGLGGDEVFLHGESGTDILQGSNSDDGLEGGDNGDHPDRRRRQRHRCAARAATTTCRVGRAPTPSTAAPTTTPAPTRSAAPHSSRARPRSTPGRVASRPEDPRRALPPEATTSPEVVASALSAVEASGGAAVCGRMSVGRKHRFIGRR